MNSVHFYIKYSTRFGESVHLRLFGKETEPVIIEMKYFSKEMWHVVLTAAELEKISHYNYAVTKTDGEFITETETKRSVQPWLSSTAYLQVIDTWNYTGEYENAFYTQPFEQTLLKGNIDEPFRKKPETHIAFLIKAPLLAANQTLGLLGSSEAFGNWKEKNIIRSTKMNDWFCFQVESDAFQNYSEYKYVVINNADGEVVCYENEANRTLPAVNYFNITTVIHDGFVHLPNNSFKGSGIAIPVFSIRTANGLGIGEFCDIKPLVDWSKNIGLKLVQLLPINDTSATFTYKDSYPYAAISAFALHPIYINLELLAGKNISKIKDILDKKEQLNQLAQVDYVEVIHLKWQAFNILFPLVKKGLSKDKAFNEYLNSNAHWLKPYAAFCYLKDKYSTPNFYNWDANNTYSETEVSGYFEPSFADFDKVLIHVWLQYHLHLQLSDAVKYAHDNHIVLKGDIPIGIYRYSADAWFNPALYNMDAQAGAPPDDFAVKGQNWGFPTYNWQKMKEDGFAWWKQRFEQLSLYFDAFRIDHILGFFRIWSIPLHAVEGIMGRFVPCLPVYNYEFRNYHIAFDENRFCNPLITEDILYNLFRQHVQFAKDTFLDIRGEEYYIRDEFKTQQQVEQWFANQSGLDTGIKNGMFDLISNVILFKDDKEENAYHFRINAHDTYSFKYFDDHTRNQIRQLYNDYFYVRQNDFWRKEALEKLPALKEATNMLICGEDLGMVPDSVPGVMRDLGLLSLEIQRMPKDPTQQFFNPANAPYLSVVTPSTHDMSTIREWWQENTNNTQTFYNTQLGRLGQAPYYAEPWICLDILKQHLFSTAMWSIFQIQDLLSIDGDIRCQNPEDERINVPADPNHYWRYRMHLSFEELEKQEGLNNKLNWLIKNSGR